MIPSTEYNCREHKECYLTYQRRLAREHEQYLQDRANTQTDGEWIADYARAKEKGLGLFFEVRARVSERAKRKV